MVNEGTRAQEIAFSLRSPRFDSLYSIFFKRKL